MMLNRTCTYSTNGLVDVVESLAGRYEHITSHKRNDKATTTHTMNDHWHAKRVF